MLGIIIATLIGLIVFLLIDDSAPALCTTGHRLARNAHNDIAPYRTIERAMPDSAVAAALACNAAIAWPKHRRHARIACHVPMSLGDMVYATRREALSCSLQLAAYQLALHSGVAERPTVIERTDSGIRYATSWGYVAYFARRRRDSKGRFISGWQLVQCRITPWASYRMPQYSLGLSLSLNTSNMA